MNIKMEIEYIGTNYSGWQKQANNPTIQEEIENKLETIYKRKITLIGSGRTDSGVHSLNQVANYHTLEKTSLNLISLKNDLNILLGSHSCKKKTYMYRIKTQSPCSVFEKNRFLFIKKNLDVEKMKDIAQVFIGNHDFINFCKTGYSGKSTKREIYSIRIIKSKKMLEIKIAGNGFLRGMVRLIVGALINYEKDKLSKSEILNALGNRGKLKQNLSVPACGLYLYDVKY
jgi:tRNA pseudouridine38-40 synthase